MSLKTDGHWFLDDRGRALLLRGVNVGGSSKTPTGCHPRDAADPSGASAVRFLGRPFPPAEADEHFGRLRHWGFNVVRLLTTWEAIEHAGPGVHDEAYLDHFAAIVRKAGDYGLYVFVDPHQDAWSRFSGGDGAPAWTLELAGFNLSALDASEAAITMWGRYPDYGTMVWPNNWYRLASATMFTLFFAGERLAPELRIDGESIQHVLQNHFLGAMGALAERLRDLPHVLGYDSLNEPTAGYIGIPSLGRPLPVYNSAPRLTGLESLAIPAGIPTEVPFVTREHLEQRVTHTVVLNSEGASAWSHPDADVWRRHGVWDTDAHGRPQLLRDDYFAGVRFVRDGLRPFLQRYGEAVDRSHPGARVFIEGEPGSREPLMAPEGVPVVNASHWYDLLTLTTKHFDPAAALVWGTEETARGREAVQVSFAAQIGAIAERSRRDLGGVPTLIGEFGLPFDLDGGAAYRTGDFSAQVEALSSYYDALDAHLAHATLWCYTADNTNADGDQWNQEDLSVFSRDQQRDRADPDSGGRAVEGFCRPSVRACAGRPRAQSFDRASGVFHLEIDASGAPVPTVVYVPRRHYPGGVACEVSSGDARYDAASQTLLWSGTAAGPQRLVIRRVRGTEP
ncbi:MAG: cellulase family glycosylhydrolase [Isosphaeraceae bacterium]|nr:cellulase family glycosylhydrolase [Isosphaeraceae bacterium]